MNIDDNFFKELIYYESLILDDLDNEDINQIINLSFFFILFTHLFF